MGRIEWDSTLETGDEMIDGQHQELFGFINHLRDSCLDGSGRDAIGVVLHKLSDYVLDHFAAEESLMMRTGLPSTEATAHMNAHAALREQTRDLLARYDAGELVTVLPLSEFLFDWLRNHIRDWDAQLAAHVRDSAARA